MKRCWDENSYAICPHTATGVSFHYAHRWDPSPRLKSRQLFHQMSKNFVMDNISYQFEWGHLSEANECHQNCLFDSGIGALSLLSRTVIWLGTFGLVGTVLSSMSIVPLPVEFNVSNRLFMIGQSQSDQIGFESLLKQWSRILHRSTVLLVKWV